MGKPFVRVLDSIHSKANPKARELILPCLSYEDVHWRRKRFGSKSSSATRHLITGRENTGGTFLTGLLPRIIEFSKQSGFDVSIRDGNTEVIRPSRRRPMLNGITFRPDQKRALRAMLRLHRGIIKFPTGSGKTYIALGFFSLYENSPRLFLCHTKELLEQTVEDIGLLPMRARLYAIGDGYRPPFRRIKRIKNPIVVSTIQTFSKYHPKEWCDYFDVTIVDECHRAAKKKSQYGRTMEYNLSPIRIGLSATPPDAGKDQLVCEGFFGPVIAELGVKQGIRKGIIARPIINLIPIPLEYKVVEKAGRGYANMYRYGIIENETRNNLIAHEVKKSLRKKEIVLIVIENTRHGELLQKVLKLKCGIRVPFVQGSTKKGTRSRIKRKLKSKRIKVAICSKVWREGVNIPSLNHIINAHGMKEKKIILQAMGRGLRTAKGKTTIKLTDFLDPYKYLAEHAILRIQIYKDQGWI